MHRGLRGPCVVYPAAVRAAKSRRHLLTPDFCGFTQPATPLRDNVQAQGNAIKNEIGSARSSFDRKAEIVDTGDGTLVSRKSLLKQSGKQVVDDGEASINNAKDVVKGLLHKDD